MPSKKPHARFEALRIQAERLIQAKTPEEIEGAQLSVSELLQELETYEIELELQNEELRTFQSELESSRAGYRHLFEFAPIGYFVFDRYGVIQDVNMTGAEQLGSTHERVSQKPFLVYLASHDRASFANHIRKVLESGERQVCDLLIQRKDGSWFYGEMQSVPFQDIETDSLRIRSALTDITERRQLEEELISEREKALQAARFMNEFLANMSHEIRTPLAGVIGFAEVLEEEVPDEQREMAKIIANGGNRLLHTLNSVLDFARLQAKHPKVAIEPINLIERVEAQLHLLRPMAEDKGLELRVEYDRAPLFALLDPNFLDRITDNLISNAIKYTERGSIRVYIEPYGDRVELRVEDTGIGISPDCLDTIFEPFHQERMGSTRSYEGVGLGLSITKRLVELMDGTIWVQSEKGRGSSFTVSFKAIAVENVPEIPPELLVPESINHDFSSCRILLVEDNWETQLLVKRLLQPVCEVTAVSGIDEALAYFKDYSCDIALLDINLGEERTGTDLLQLMRALPGIPPFRAVAFTAYALPSDQKYLLAQGFDDYLAKPFAKSDLIDMLARSLMQDIK